MFCIAGILADEEPKIPITSSGDANMAYMGNGSLDYPLSKPIFEGSNNWSISFWATPVLGGLHKRIYEEDIDGDVAYIELTNTNLKISIPTSAMTTSVIEYDFPLNIGDTELHHYAVTANVTTDAEAVVYVDGVSVHTSVLSYANKSGSTTQKFMNGDYYISTFSKYWRRLNPSDVTDELYIYDDSLMFAGARGFDSLPSTGLVKTTLEYFVSFTEDISYAGNEFRDKVVFGGTPNDMSNTSAITFGSEEVYVYTNINDLPSATTEYSVNSANFTTSLTSLSAGTANPLTTESYSMVAFVKRSATPSSTEYLMGKFPDGGNPSYGLTFNSSGNLALLHSGGNQLSNYYQKKTDTNYADNSYHLVIAYVDTTGEEIYFNVDGSNVASSIQNNSGNPWGSASNSASFYIGRRTSTGNDYEGEGAFFGLAVGQDLRSVASDLYAGSQKARCWDSLQPATQAMFTHFWEAGTYNGSVEADALEDKVGTTDLTNSSVVFTGSGLTVEC